MCQISRVKNVLIFPRGSIQVTNHEHGCSMLWDGLKGKLQKICYRAADVLGEEMTVYTRVTKCDWDGNSNRAFVTAQNRGWFLLIGEDGQTYMFRETYTDVNLEPIGVMFEIDKSRTRQKLRFPFNKNVKYFGSYALSVEDANI